MFGTAPVYFLGGTSVLKAVIIGYILSLGNITLGYFSIRWSFRKSAKIFYLVIFGGLAVRFIIFFMMLFLIVKFTSLSVTGFAFSFIVFYVFLQYQEIRFINDELKASQKKI